MPFACIIKKCTEVTIEDLLSIFHKMGRIQYFLQYKNLSIIFCEGANSAFEEAVGSVITLSASSHKHLLNIGLLSLKHQDSGDEDQGPKPGAAARARWGQGSRAKLQEDPRGRLLTALTLFPEDEVNFLMRIALEKIAFIPFGYLMDLFHWKVFDGSIRKDIYNQEWWNLRWVCYYFPPDGPFPGLSAAQEPLYNLPRRH
ncbi:angiotensin-converting enzyme-like protein Ace3 [Papio anubis]|uniref:angiotensin-converting enzyme-like protein Ace3 n=1 Tax=Papio anubis TaxID=9555 RepID=UPI0012ADC296|nr:angiotensin-converting enzyme-like protein Ace3 [Papio anubis]